MIKHNAILIFVVVYSVSVHGTNDMSFGLDLGEQNLAVKRQGDLQLGISTDGLQKRQGDLQLGTDLSTADAQKRQGDLTAGLTTASGDNRALDITIGNVEIKRGPSEDNAVQRQGGLELGLTTSQQVSPAAAEGEARQGDVSVNVGDAKARQETLSTLRNVMGSVNEDLEAARKRSSGAMNSALGGIMKPGGFSLNLGLK